MNVLSFASRHMKRTKIKNIEKNIKVDHFSQVKIAELSLVPDLAPLITTAHSTTRFFACGKKKKKNKKKEK